MAADSNLMYANRRIANAIMDFAHSHDWNPKEWAVYMREDEEWDRLHVILVAKAFEGRDNYECYREIWDHLANVFSDEPTLLGAISLVVMDPREAKSGGIFGIGRDYSELPKEAIP